MLQDPNHPLLNTPQLSILDSVLQSVDLAKEEPVKEDLNSAASAELRIKEPSSAVNAATLCKTFKTKMTNKLPCIPFLPFSLREGSVTM
jgi:hypothetical protein